METSNNESAAHNFEDELGVVIYPGTEVMRETEGHQHLARSSGRSSAVLIPQPSDDPHDPLNWSPRWKFIVIFLATATTFTQGFGPTALGPFFPDLEETFGRSLSDVVRFTGIAILILGFSNFFWVPIQNAYGRRPVLIASTLICCISNIWRAVATSYQSEIGACALNGFGAGPAETTQPQVIADIIFLHDRGAYQTVYFTFYFGSLMLGPAISGAMAFHVGWRSFFWLNVALLGAVFILLIFLFPETKWPRRDELGGQQQDQTVERGKDDSFEVPQSNGVDLESPPKEKDAEQPPAANLAPWLRKGYPSKKQFMLWQIGDGSLRNVIVSFVTPWELLLFPIVELAAFIVSWSASGFLSANLTQSHAFAGSPYLYSSQTIGFFNFALFIGALIGLATNGPLSDWISMRATNKNGGIREPEMRLPALIPYLIICVLGYFIVAFGYEYDWPWPAIVIIGYSCLGIQVAAIPAIITTYAIDSYKPVAGLLFVAITVNKNLWGYGFSKFINPWIAESGFVKPLMLNMCLTILFCLCTVPFYYYGKTMRRWTAKSHVHRM